MTKQEALDFVTTALALAMSSDGGSGGVIRVKVVNKEGVEDRYVPGNEIEIFGSELKQPRMTDAMVIG